MAFADKEQNGHKPVLLLETFFLSLCKIDSFPKCQFTES